MNERLREGPLFSMCISFGAFRLVPLVLYVVPSDLLARSVAVVVVVAVVFLPD